LLLEPELRELQERLAAVELYDGQINGIMDDGLGSAILDYQAHADLTPEELSTKELLNHVRRHATIVARSKRIAESDASAVYEQAKRALAISRDIEMKTLGPDRINAGVVEVEVRLSPPGPGVLWLFNETAKPLLVGSIRIHQPLPLFRSRWMPFIGKTGELITAFVDAEGHLQAGKASFWVYENRDSKSLRKSRNSRLSYIAANRARAEETEFTEFEKASLIYSQGGSQGRRLVFSPKDRHLTRSTRPETVYLRGGVCRCRNKSTGEIERSKNCLRERVWSLEDGEPLFTESLTRETAGATYALGVDFSLFADKGLVITAHAFSGERASDHLVAMGIGNSPQAQGPGTLPAELPDRCVRQLNLVAQGSDRAEPINAERLSNCASRYQQSLRDADLSQIDLERFSVRDVDLRGADFSGSNLFGAGFVKAELLDALFEGADLKEARFQRADLRGPSFRGADLRRAYFNYGDVAGADFTGANLQGVRLSDVENVDQAIGLELQSLGAAQPGLPIPQLGAPQTRPGQGAQLGKTDGSAIAEQLVAHLGGKRVYFQSPPMANQPPMDVSVFVCSNGEFLFKDNLAAEPGSIGGLAMRTGRWRVSSQAGRAVIELHFSNGEQMAYQAMVRGGVTYMNGNQVAVSDDNGLCR
jgi:hypothetical protein